MNEDDPEFCTNCRHWDFDHGSDGCGRSVPLGGLCVCPGFEPDPFGGLTSKQVAEHWNRTWQVGVMVMYWPIDRMSAASEGRTNSGAFVQLGAAVVRIGGFPSPVALTHIKVPSLDPSGCGHPPAFWCLRCGSDDTVIRTFGKEASR